MRSNETKVENVRRVSAKITAASQTDLAKIGLMALIDEATSFQAVRPVNALEQELDKLKETHAEHRKERE